MVLWQQIGYHGFKHRIRLKREQKCVGWTSSYIELLEPSKKIRLIHFVNS